MQAVEQPDSRTVNEELLRVLFRNQLTSAIANGLLGWLLAYIVWGQFHDSRVLAWGAIHTGRCRFSRISSVPLPVARDDGSPGDG